MVLQALRQLRALGINAKMNEFEAAMGLCVLDDIEQITASRRKVFETYQKELEGLVQFQQFNKYSNNNFAYAPILFKSEHQLLKAEKTVKRSGVFALGAIFIRAWKHSII